MNKVSIVINTLNEENDLPACLKSVKEFADEIIICDMYSDDNTINIAKSFNAKIVYHERVGFVEPARYFAITQASHEWVLVLDADERMTPKLADKLKEIMKSGIFSAVSIWFLYNYFGKYIKHGGFYINNIRLFKKSVYLETYTKEEELVHNNFKNLRDTKNMLVLPKGYHLIHEAYPKFEKYLQKTLCNYAIIESNGLYDSGEKVKFIVVILKPIKEFVRRYIFLHGYREGKIGFILCYLKSQYSFYILLNIWLKNLYCSREK